MASFKTDGKAILLVFIAALITIVFLITIADQIVLNTETQRIDNETVTAGAVNATVDLIGRGLVTRVAVYNASEDQADNVNMVLRTGISATTGLQSVQLIINDTVSEFAGLELNVSYVHEPDGYINGGGARSITILVIILGALAILIFVIKTFVKEGTLGDIIRGG